MPNNEGSRTAGDVAVSNQSIPAAVGQHGVMLEGHRRLSMRACFRPAAQDWSQQSTVAYRTFTVA
jgi:hypothetical protein